MPLEIRNLDDRLVCRFHEETQTIEIVYKTCVTLIQLTPIGTVQVQNIRK